MGDKYHTGLTPAAREIMKALGRFRMRDVIDGLGTKVQTYKDQTRVKKAVFDCHKREEITRIERGLYEYTGKKKPPAIQDKMWKVLRANRSVTVEDLQELAGAAESYAKEWLQMLARNGVVRRMDNGKWRMIHDPVEMPKNEGKAARLRNMRLRKEEALAALIRAKEAITEAEKAIAEV
jgi:hypothetical protein